MGWGVFIISMLSSVVVENKLMLHRYWGVGFCILLTLSSVSLEGADARSVARDNFPGTLSLHDGRLTANLNAAPLRQVMEEIGNLSGAEIVWLQRNIGGMVSADFSDVPLTRALRLLLGEKNFLLFYSSEKEGTHLSQIWVSSGGSVPTTAPSSSSVSATLIRQWYQTAMRGANVPLRLEAVGRLKQHAPNNVRAKRMLSLVARLADNPQVKKAAAAAVPMMRARQ